MASRTEILSILQTRYDHFSAHNVWSEVLEVTKLESKAKYEPAEVKKTANALVRLGNRIERVVDRIKALDSPRSATKAEAPEPEAAPAEAAPAEEAPAEEAASDDAPAKKAKKGKKG